MNNYLIVFLSFIPIIWLLISLSIFKMKPYRACTIALIISAAVAFQAFKMNPVHIFQSLLEGSIYSILSICWVIISALLVYNITVKTGALEIIKTMLSNVSNDRRIQALVLAFCFGGFLEAVAGFGTSVAIPLGILIAMGFKPLKGAILCLVANTVPVALGVIGVPITSLAQATGLDITKLAYYVCIQLLPFATLLPLLLVYIVTDSIKKIKGVIIVSILSGFAFAVGQTITSLFIAIEISAVVGSLFSLGVIILWCKFIKIKDIYYFDDDEKTDNKVATKITAKEALIAWSPYIIVLVLIIIVQSIPLFKKDLFIISKQIYYGPSGGILSFNWITSGGTLFFIASFLSGFIQGLKVSDILSIFKKTLIQLKLSILTTILVVVIAKIMTYSGMIEVSASFIATVSGKYFPLISPLIGTVGTFITGSDTSSNILFGNLQKQTALNLNLDEYWIAAGNGSGATAGKMISPQSMSIASSTTNGSVEESQMMSSTIKYCILYVLLMGIFVYVFHF